MDRVEKMLGRRKQVMLLKPDAAYSGWKALMILRKCVL